MKTRKSLGDSLVEKGIITKSQLQKAEVESKKTYEPLRKVLVRLGMIKEADIINFFEQELNISYINMDSYVIDPKIIAMIPDTFAKKAQVIPIFKTRDILTVAMVDPLDVMTLDDLRTLTKCIVEPMLTSEADFEKAYTQYYKTGANIYSTISSIHKEVSDDDPTQDKEEDTSTEKMRLAAEQAPIIKLVNLLIDEAITNKASDIHINPEENVVRIRYRIDGILHETSTLPKNLQAAVISRIKIMSEMNIAVKRHPQDGRLQVRLRDKQVELRVSSFPTIHGENLVMRILDPDSVMLGLDDLGLDKANLELFKQMIKRPHGIFLVTGPTGSGKTTTLYSALSSINSIDKNIITLEDPVEYQLEMVRQAQINIKAGLTFANGLRSILRQDPDIILVGEIRDKETAEIAVQSALTGHLVFSTLHTNDAPGALTRLIDMGIEPFLVSSSIVGILAQRLVRRLCPACRKSYTPEKELLDGLGIPANKDVKLYAASGCAKCKSTGYKGRIGIYELLAVDEEVREMVIRRQSADAIRKYASEKKGMQALRRDGISKALEGITTIEEVLRVTTTD